MILQALTRYYEDLLTRGEIAAPGWSPAKISFALCLDENGAVIQVIPTMQEVVAGKKTVRRPQEIVLPAAVKRTVGVASNFLWDNSTYLLGVDQKGKPARSRECFQAAAQLHHAILDGVESPAARAILAFFDTWDPSMAAEHPALRASFDDITGSSNLVFRVDSVYPQDDPAIRAAWQTHRDGGDPNAVRLQCLVTGREDEISATHPAIKGVRDAQSSGAALVSFNAPAFCSYGREQNYNAPVGKHAAFAYTAALNHLLADKSSVQTIGDTTVVCWAEGAEPVYQDYAQAFLFGGETPKGLSDNDLRAALKRLAERAPAWAALFVTADHGMVNVPEHQRIDYSGVEELTRNIAMTAGEPRAVHLYLEDTSEAARTATAQRWAQYWGERAWVMDSRELMRTGYFGPVITDAARGRIGDLMVCARDDWALYDMRHYQERALHMVGQHGSLTDAERLVPLRMLKTF